MSPLRPCEHYVAAVTPTLLYKPMGLPSIFIRRDALLCFYIRQPFGLGQFLSHHTSVTISINIFKNLFH